MPTHVVIAHALVMLCPAVAVAALCWAVLPAARNRLFWPVLLGTVASLALSLWAGNAGRVLWRELGEQATAQGHPLSPLVAQHAHGSDALVVALGVLLLAVLLCRRSLTRGQRGWAARTAAWLVALCALCTLGATALVTVQAMQAVWATH